MSADATHTQSTDKRLAVVGVAVPEAQVAEHERQFRELLELCPAALVIVDDDGRLLFHNARLRELMGYEREELDRIDTRTFWHDLEQRSRIIDALRDQGGQLLNEKVVWRTKKGQLVHLLISYVQVAYRGGHVSFVGGKRLCWVYDVTALTQREAQVAEQERQLREILEYCPAGLIVVDDEGKLLFHNARLRELLEYGKDELQLFDTKRFWYDLDHRARIVERLRERGGQLLNEEVIWRTKQGRLLNLLISYVQVAYQGGHVSFAGGRRLCWVYDITALRRAEQARIQSEHRLAEAIESISEGFVCYDPDDRLVICNSCFSEVLYPGFEAELAAGARFETFIQHAAERGYVKDAEGRVEEWIAERMAYHRNPGPPHVQQRSSGRWVMVSERRTEDGGTVGVYSDITELKQREQDLTAKSAALASLSAKLAKYLAPQVYDSIFAGRQEVKIASKRKKLTVCFSDLVGFTELTDKLESEDLTQLLNHYLTEMARIALQYGATIDKYVGDAILMFFGDPDSRGVKQDALACVRMALAMQKRIAELSEQWRDLGVETPLRARIGIHTGYCTVGNFGSEDRMDYTIIGSEVNLAARLQTQAEQGGILLAHETWSLTNDIVAAVEREPVEVKGFARPVRNYAVLGLQGEAEADGKVFRRERPGFGLSFDLGKLDAADRKAAIRDIEQALAQLRVEPS